MVLGPAAVGGLVRIRTGLARRLTAGTEAMRADAAARLAVQRTEHRLRIGAEIETVVLSGLEQLRPQAAGGDLADVTALRDLGRELLAGLRELLTRLRDAEGVGAGGSLNAPCPG
ncbi:hypothetical protein [Streptomyces sp. MK5]|uniref:hypothetical protein n=1 Tax=Streptomyces sp. MK5 TaxID=3064253 RepID=UPI0035582F8E